MATPSPTPNAVTTFMRITGAPEFVAVQKLEEYGGNLNAAVNAHFIEGDRHMYDNVGQNLANATQYNNYSDGNNQNHVRSRGVMPFLSAARRFRPSLLLDSNYRRELRDLCNGTLTSHAPLPPHAIHPGESTEVAAGTNNAFEPPYRSRLSSTSADMTENLSSHGRGVYGTDYYQNDYSLAQSNSSHVSDNDIEEAMIQAAIQASKKESDAGHPQSHSQQEDDDLAHAMSLSLEIAEQEEAMREHLVKKETEGLAVHDLPSKGEKNNNSRSRKELGTSSNRDLAQDAAQPFMGHPLNHSAGGHLQRNEDMLIADKWGISSDELNEALMLETALFGEIPNHSSHKHSSLPDLQHHPEKIVNPKMQCLSSATSQLLTDTQLLRQQQDADYLASLRADKQKEFNSLKKAETHSSMEEESCKKVRERKELENMLDKKEVRLSKEPPLDDENAITIVVRMPDGGRCERRFLKTDKLQFLFNFIDTLGAVKPGTYKVVRSYPRRAYSINDSSSTLYEVGLSSKNEALFLEVI
ncbi:plant UBX domain-containing protein 8-like [Gastrolobium bilobum]|uniref:plant UBX domain-containing protein 8-like n=1 Tax=Gastrolobium bilobum TaxID=150636 RepID=UPI002AB2B974|nr:plant UBX domain-containing protein 8-like [Gastrolobium bilobum]